MSIFFSSTVFHEAFFHAKTSTSSCATLKADSNFPQCHKKDIKSLYTTHTHTHSTTVVCKGVVSFACWWRSEQAMNTECSERSKKGTQAATSPRCNNKGIFPTSHTPPESGPIPESQPTSGKEPGSGPGLPHLVDVPVGAAADPLDELVVLLRVPPQDVRGRPQRGLHLRSGPGPRRLSPRRPDSR